MFAPSILSSFNLLAAIDPLPHVMDHPQIIVGNWWVLTNHMIMLLMTAVIMLIVFPAMTRRFRSGELVMTGTNNFFEAILLYMRDEVFKPLLGDETDKFIGFLWTLFFFILINNLLGLLPLDIITRPVVTLLHFPLTFHAAHTPHENEGIFGTATGNFYVTATLALCAFVVIQVNGIKDNGIGGWLKHFLGGAPVFMAPIMVPVELLGMLIKPCALAIRLAANMTAGHILLAVIIAFTPLAYGALGAGGGVAIGLISVVSAVAILCLELFVAFLQAYLFAFLTALFISQLAHHEDHDGEHESTGDELSESHGVRAADAHHHPVSA